MDRYLKDNLECYLSGQLGASAKLEFKRRMAARPRDRAEIERMSQLSKRFAAFDLPREDGLGPLPGFHNRVLGRIERERRPSLLDCCLRPTAIRGVAFASCSWLLLLVSLSLYQASARASVEHIAETVLAQPPESADYCNVRLGCDIDLNRKSMLAAVIKSGQDGR